MGNKINTVNDALPLNAGGFNKRLGVFGGESAGFAGDVLEQVTKSFYGTRAEADLFTVAKGMVSPIPKSIFNRYALFNFRGMHGGLIGDSPFDQYKDVPNNPLMGGHTAQNITIAKLIEFFEEFYPKIGYRAQDFLYLKHYRKIPVNHLVTLRRFPMPVNDNIFDSTERYAEKGSDEADKIADTTQVAGVTAVTYLGETAGNKLDDILKFSYGLNWKELKSEMTAIDSGGGLTSQPFYNKIGPIGRAAADALKGVKTSAKFAAQNAAGDDRFGTTYAQFVIGPVNVVDKTFIRERGLKFDNDIKLTFDYELKSLNYVNPKIAMIDIISNMLTMTTNNAQFFGGGHRYYGAQGYVASTFGDMGQLRNGNFSGYMESVLGDVTTGISNVFGAPGGGFSKESLVNGLGTIGKSLKGGLLGGLINSMMGSMGNTAAQPAFISGEPTGNWHITVGNPLNPIVMMGNMYCDNTIMTLGNGLGYDDFPVEVKFEIDLKHGKPRDKGDIENMFNAGRGRIYASEPKPGGIDEDVQTYGSVPGDKSKLENGQSGAFAGTANSKVIANLKPKTNGNVDRSTSPQYIGNLISMIVDS